jgi:hypothetical protein
VRCTGCGAGTGTFCELIVVFSLVISSCRTFCIVSQQTPMLRNFNGMDASAAIQAPNLLVRIPRQEI